ncbi:hypothetical protein SAMN04487765_2018 [Tenacibaculum sp. MAR_2010_89]|uniref:hypothetical protein n=1 Tax=Tenacibaculum sp. MAR_2010_89 TaxID=1250198 RepID=UPI00089505C0|nr:hypothetical protein [Tenacibaculum sp. MAR_2010_89]SEE28855.1 hypothetical protein SAMN04487765_2018 [Tenacibaculum sp. MAR_2010_89]
MKKLKLTITLFTLILLNSCALKPITSQYNFVKTTIKNIRLNDLGNGNILIYNGSNILHKIDNTARLNIWLDNKPLGQIRPNEYVIINLKKGKHHFKVLHIDVVNMRSKHEIEIDNDTKVIKIKPTITSNKLEVTNKLPKKFSKFKYAKKRDHK